MGSDELEQEQQYVTTLYRRLDELRDRAAESLARTRRAPASGTPAGRAERDAFVAWHESRLAQLRAVEEQLCFGRLDLASGQRRYIGRIGLSDDDQAQLLVDWRAPAAEAFYQATAATPHGVVRRRHLETRHRNVVTIEDDVLDIDALDESQARGLVGEGALLVALDAERTGRMRDIVATIQAEQDRIIRAPLPGILVVQGGPGTGKTVVALHRAAYLLYTYRDRIARSGVLLVGPNRRFLRYIEQVLPSLGETGAVMATPAQLFPGVEVTGVEDPAVAGLKGDLRMAEVIATAVRQRQRVPDQPQRLQVDGDVIVLHPKEVAASQARARRSRKPYNPARVSYVRDVLNHLADRLATVRDIELSAENRRDLIADLRASRDVRRAVNLSWWPLTPQRLLADLFADPARLAAAAGQLTLDERRLLHRDRDSPWTEADVPLLDEVAELLGEDDSVEQAAAARAAMERRAEVAYARQVLEMSGAAAMITAEDFADRWADAGPSVTVAERAAGDRTWAFGHVVVDEAQELSPMMWRVLMRRCPSRSMTIVGDIAQTGSVAGAHSWGRVLRRHVHDNWRVEELTVNYRTPRDVMTLAGDLLHAAGIQARTPDSVRDGRWPPTAQRIDEGDFAAVAAAVRVEWESLGGGRLAVITSRRAYGAVADALLRDLPEGATAMGEFGHDAPVAVLTVAEAKGLEFDTVVLVEPAAILAESPRGASDLYVALTRPTQRLRVLHSGELPYALARLQTSGSG